MSAHDASDFEAEQPLGYYVDASVRKYFKQLNGHAHAPGQLYQLVLSEVEKPLLRRVLDHCDGNYSRAAETLGINRATLRKKMHHYQIPCK